MINLRVMCNIHVTIQKREKKKKHGLLILLRYIDYIINNIIIFNSFFSIKMRTSQL